MKFSQSFEVSPPPRNSPRVKIAGAGDADRVPKERPMSRRSTRPSRARLRSACLAAACLLWAGTLLAQPTVNGLFHGDGDNAVYNPYATSENGSVLYSYLDASTSILYVALVVDHSVNDLVCAPETASHDAYMKSADWCTGGPDGCQNAKRRSCKKASDSEFAAFTLECEPGSTTNAWSWMQALGCPPTPTTSPTWISGTACGGASGGGEPPGIVMSTSWVENVNAYLDAAMDEEWNLTGNSTNLNDWKSPFVASSPNDVTLVPGYPTYSGTADLDGGGAGPVEWEWSMVYEWSVPLGPGGADCANEAIFFIAGQSHHSPGKGGDEDDTFDPPPDPFSDWGDLPDSYSTTSGAGGPLHYITVDGPRIGSDIQAETNGQPTNDATGDGAEEDGVSANVTSDWTEGSSQSFEVEVSNAPGGAVLGVWIDWNGDNVFTADEFITMSVVNGTNTLTVTVALGSGFDWSTDDLYTRFRIFSSGAAAPGGSLDAADFGGTATDGEVEDHVFEAGSLPVTLNAFTTEGAAGGELTVRWQTASETENVAFEVRGLVDGTWRSLSELIPSASTNSGLAQSYEVRVETLPGLTAVELVDFDSRGRQERFGAFRVGEAYGEFQPVRTIDWSGPRRERDDRLRERGFEDTARGAAVLRPDRAGAWPDAARWKRVRAGAPLAGLAGERQGGSTTKVAAAAGTNGTPTSGIEVAAGASTHVAVTEAGIQVVTYESLRDGGLDLAGVPAKDVAVTWRGEPVARWIDGGTKMGPGSAIEFIGRPPAGDDALYVDASLYQVSVDPSRARTAGFAGQGKAKKLSDSYARDVGSDRPLRYDRQSPTGDPWLERTVLVRGSATVTLDLPIAGPVAEGPGQVVVGLGSMTDLPDLRDAGGAAIPEHNVEVWFRGPTTDFVQVATSSISGQRDWRIEAPVPAGWLAAGVHQIQLRFSTQYLFSFVAIDRYGVSYPSPYRGPSLDFAPDPWADGYRVEGFAGSAIAVYAEGPDGALTRVEPRVVASGSGHAAEIRQLAAERVWVSETPRSPAVFTTEAPGDLLGGTADLLVLADSSFVGTPALDEYLAQKAGFDPLVVDVEDVYNAYGFGMALPSAITDFLRARDAVSPLTHVQLVGTDCYDRLNYVSSCVSFIPLPTARVGLSWFTPSQNRLVDLDGDGIGDKAVAQFSVRDASELATIVGKGEAWDASGLSAADSALLISEETDGVHSFSSQIERLESRLGWSDTEVIDLADHPSIQTARDAMKASLAAGRTLTVFSGHSSPTIWSVRSLLTPAVAAALTNHGKPTLMVPLACETTYDISPNANLLGHQLLFAGDHGALAISGAVALSGLDTNELMANHVLDGLKAGHTLGEAVQNGRSALGRVYQELQDNWITQGDVTLRLAP